MGSAEGQSPFAGGLGVSPTYPPPKMGGYRGLIKDLQTLCKYKSR